MQTKISETTALSGFAAPSGKKLLKVHAGKYLGRMISVVKTSDNEIKYCYANSPYDSWSSLVTIVSDSSNDTIDVTMNSNGDVYLVYCEQSTNYLVSVKLTITDTGWTIGSKVYVYTGYTNIPSITIDSDNILYVAFALYNASQFDLHVKTSTDDAVTWGTSSSDTGEVLAAGYSLVIPKIMTSENLLHVVYVTDWTAIREMSRALSGSSWSSEFVIVTSTDIDIHFDATVLPGGFIGVVYDDTQLNYREYNGNSWSPITLLDSNEAFFPQITIFNNVPIVLYFSEFGPDEYQLMQTNRLTGTFSIPTILDKRSSQFDSLILYDSISSTYEDKTLEAGNGTTADVVHSISSALCKSAGDKIYCGSDNKFRIIKMHLSTVGAGGLVSFAYYDGSNWKSFTPASGAYHLDSTSKEILLWADFDSSPVAWQKNRVNGVNRFWIKIEVTAEFSTEPIGTQITSISNLNSISVRR